MSNACLRFELTAVRIKKSFGASESPSHGDASRLALALVFYHSASPLSERVNNAVEDAVIVIASDSIFIECRFGCFITLILLLTSIVRDAPFQVRRPHTYLYSTRKCSHTTGIVSDGSCPSFGNTREK